MPTSSVIFDPEINERKLDKQADTVNSRFNEAATDLQIDGDIGDFGSGGALRPSMGGMQGMGGDPMMGMGAGAAAGGLADRIPKPVSGVTASSAIPIALAGATGVGMLSAMRNASGQLRSTTSMFGTAMDMFFRPFGDFLGAALRPMAMDLISFTSEFSNVASSEGLAAGIEWLAPSAVSAMSSAFSNVLGGEGSLGDWLVTGLGTVAVTRLITGASITSFLTPSAASSVLGSVGASSVLSTVSAGTVLGAVSAGAVLTGISAAAVITSVALSDLITEDQLTFEWGAQNQIPAFLQPLSGTATETAESLGTLNQRLRENNDLETGGDGTGFELTDETIQGLSNQEIVSRLQRDQIDYTRLVDALSGSRLQEIAMMRSQSDSTSTTNGGGSDTSEVEDKLDQVNRNLKNLGGMHFDVNVDGETIARVSEDSRRNRLTDTDPMA